MRIFLVTLTPSAAVVEPIKFDRDQCLWLDASSLGGICTGLADAYEAWLTTFGSSQTEFQVRAVDSYGRATSVVSRVVTRTTCEKTK